MAYTPTGRSRGRPKTKEYGTIAVRMPADLIEKVKRYASVHRCSVSELIRDGLEMRLEADEVPGRSPRRHTDNGDTPPLPENSDTVLHELSPMVLAAIQEAVRETIHTVLPVPHGEHGESVIQQSPISVLQQYTGESQHAAEALEAEPTVSETPLDQRPVQAESRQPDATADDFDHTKFYLGKLCPKGHMYGDSGFSLLRRHNQHCRECEKEAKRQARARQKAIAQAQEV